MLGRVLFWLFMIIFKFVIKILINTEASNVRLINMTGHSDVDETLIFL